MCELTLEETGLARKQGAEILNMNLSWSGLNMMVYHTSVLWPELIIKQNLIPDCNCSFKLSIY